jgi:hypothetical protein
MAAPIEVHGLKELRAALKDLGPQWGRELSKIHRQIAKDVAARAQDRARGMGRQQRANAGAIKGSGTASAASVRVKPTSKYPAANPAFWGQIKRSGWYAAKWAESHTGKPQSLPWVGNNWEAGVHGQGPYAVNDAVADRVPQIMDAYVEMIDDLTARAFPDH